METKEKNLDEKEQEFFKIRDFAEQFVLPSTKKWAQQYRQKLRNKIRRCESYLDLEDTFSLFRNNRGFPSYEEMIESWENKNIPTQEEENKTLKNLNKKEIHNVFLEIKEILEKFMDLQRKEDYSLVALWIIGTYFHKQFSAYPYLYFNAMKGSGKTRILKLISNLSRNGRLVGSMTEAVLFRTAKERTLCIDEIEMMSKTRENLQLLLNSAYKKGLVVERLAKRKTKEGEEQKVEEFEVYCPIAMANIWGMDNTLSDRCISLVLEKSSKNSIIKLIENFEQDESFLEIREKLNELTECLENNSLFDKIFVRWNEYQKNVVSNVSNVNVVNDVNVVSNSDDIYDIDAIYYIFDKVNIVNLSGRDLELFFPLYIIADICGCLEEILVLSEFIVKERKESDREENRDVRLIEFLSQSEYSGFCDVATIVKDFQDYLGEEEKWINSKGISRALKRLGLILDRRSTGKKRQVKLDILKAKEKILMFKEKESSGLENEQKEAIINDPIDVIIEKIQENNKIQ